MKVEILEQLEDGSQHRIATFEWQEGSVTCDNPVLWRNLVNATGGTITGARGKRFTPEDGLEYLRSLKFHFAGPYLFAGPLLESSADPVPARKIPPSQAVTQGFSAVTPRANPASPALPSGAGVGGGAGAASSTVRPGPTPAARPAASPAPSSAGDAGSAALRGVPGRSSSPVRTTGGEGGILTGSDLRNNRQASSGDGAESEASRRNKLPAGVRPDTVRTTPAPLTPAEVARSREITKPMREGREREGREREGSESPGRSRSSREEGFSRDLQERLYGSVFRLVNAVRSLSLPVLLEEAELLQQLLAQQIQIDLGALKRSFEVQEEHQELRFLLTARANYPKAWERLGRYTFQFLEVLEQGELAEALRPLTFLHDGATGLIELRNDWRHSHSLPPIPYPLPFGTSALEMQESWGEVGMPAFRVKGLSVSLIEDIFRKAAEPLRTGVAHFQQADLGSAEASIREALRHDPGNLEARLILGDILRRLDRYDDAHSELDRVIELEHLSLRAGGSGAPKSSNFLHLARARTCLGRVMLATGRMQGAMDQLERGLDALEQHGRRFPDDVIDAGVRARVKAERLGIHRLLEPLYRALGDMEKADHHRHLQHLPQ